MKKYLKFNRSVGLLFGLLFLLHACGIPEKTTKAVDQPLPEEYTESKTDTINTSQVSWRNFFQDQTLNQLIDSALVHNKELNILLQRMAYAQNEIMAREGEYLPFLTGGVGADVEKVGRYTRNGAVEDNIDITDGQEFPEFLGNMQLGLNFSWELDIWKKLHNSKKVAALEYLASIEGRQFMVTNLIAEIANSYFELIAYKNQLQNLEQNIKLQQDAYEVVKLLKEGAKANSLAVKRFEAEVKKNQSHIFEIKQNIFVTENKINFLVGRTPETIHPTTENILDIEPKAIQSGIPSQLLENRPDIRKAELEMAAAELDIEVAKANFYPQFAIKAGLGYGAFNPKYLFNTPASLLVTLAGEAVAPLINKKAIQAEYKNANARHVAAVFEYEQSILKAYYEVVNELSNIENLDQNYQLKEEQVLNLTESIEISNLLFQSARADYMEVLLTQRDALEAKMELIKTKKERLAAMVDLYRALGGGWL